MTLCTRTLTFHSVSKKLSAEASDLGVAVPPPVVTLVSHRTGAVKQFRQTRVSRSHGDVQAWVYVPTSSDTGISEEVPEARAAAARSDQPGMTPKAALLQRITAAETRSGASTESWSPTAPPAESPAYANGPDGSPRSF